MGLARRFARAGHGVTVGSRHPERAAGIVESAEAPRPPGNIGTDRRWRHPSPIRITGHAEAIDDAECVVLALPPAVCAPEAQSLADRLAGRVVVSCANPLGGAPAGEDHPVPFWPSIAELTQRAAPRSSVVAAFHHVAAMRLWDLQDTLDDCDVLVCGDDPDATDLVARLAEAVTGRRGVEAGPLRLARQVEAFTPVLMAIGQARGGLPGLRIPSAADASNAVGAAGGHGATTHGQDSPAIASSC
jgi:NADPH-dependent F420 reductase